MDGRQGSPQGKWAEDAMFWVRNLLCSSGPVKGAGIRSFKSLSFSKLWMFNILYTFTIYMYTYVQFIPEVQFTFSRQHSFSPALLKSRPLLLLLSSCSIHSPAPTLASYGRLTTLLRGSRPWMSQLQVVRWFLTAHSSAGGLIWTVVLEEIPESPLDSTESKPVNP